MPETEGETSDEQSRGEHDEHFEEGVEALEGGRTKEGLEKPNGEVVVGEKAGVVGSFV